MDYQKAIALIAQKGFSGAAGVVGIKILMEANFQAENWIGSAVAGCFLVTLAVVIEFLVWREGNAFIKDRINKIEAEKRKSDDRLEKFETALLERFSTKKSEREAS